MSNLKTGYYAYNANHGIRFIGHWIEVIDIRKDSVLVTPSNFHESVVMYTFSETIITFFTSDNPLLMDLENTHTIGNLTDD
jgi:hypothetical protein